MTDDLNPEKQAKLLDKLAKLRAMAEGAEAIGSEAEAQAFATMFQTLLTKYKVDMTDLELATMEKEEPVNEHRIDYRAYPDLKLRRRRIEWIEDLATIVAGAYFCRILVHPGSSRISLVGRPSDCKLAEYMIVTLQRSAEKIANKANYDWGTEVQKRTGSRDGPDRYGFKQAFLNAFISRLGQRFREERAVQSGASSTALVRVNKAEKDVVDFIKENIKGKASELQTASRYHREGFRRGKEAADSINLRANAIDKTVSQRRLK